MTITPKMSLALNALKAEAEKHNMPVEIIDNKAVIDGSKVVEVIDENETPLNEVHSPLTQREMANLITYRMPEVIPMADYSSGQERRRERRAKERKNKKK